MTQREAFTFLAAIALTFGGSVLAITLSMERARWMGAVVAIALWLGLIAYAVYLSRKSRKRAGSTEL